MYSGLRRLGVQVVTILCGNRALHATAFFVLSSNSGGCRASSTSRLMSSSSTGDEMRVIRVLALHGSEGNAEEFPSRLDALKTVLEQECNVRMEITPVEGPFEKGGGYSWWKMKPGERSFTAKVYGGFDVAAERVLEAWDSDPPFDLVLGHSQGAILIAALISLGKAPYHPHMGYVLNGVSFPNPYREQVKALNFDKSTGTRPRVLFVMGTNDRITPNETGEELRDSFLAAGLEVESLKHPGGHALPNKQDETVGAIAKWLTQ